MLDNFFECDYHYIVDKKSYGFRLKSEYRYRDFVRIITDIDKCKKEIKIPNLREYKKLRTWFETITIKELNLMDLFMLHKDTQEKMQMINEEGVDFTNPEDDFGLRCHHTLTSLPKEARKYILSNGKPLVEVDICNSQILFFAAILKQTKIKGIDKFVKLAETGTFYDYFCNYGFNRSEVKEEWVTRILFTKNGYNSKIKSIFKKEFVEVNEEMERLKRKDLDVFAKMLQRKEARFVIHTICQALGDNNTFFIPIHDSWLMRPEDCDLLMKILKQNSQDLGVKVPVKIKKLGDV